MILDFTGGAKPSKRSAFLEQKIKIHDTCSAVCIKAEPGFEISATVGAAVNKGALLGVSGGMPVYSSIAGRFGGVLELEGQKYFAVMNRGETGEERLCPPETNSINEMSREYIIETAKKFGIIDQRSGRPLFELLEKKKRFRRVVVDCTESDPLGCAAYRLCVEYPKEVVGGAKILVRATDALKCVFAAEYNRDKLFEKLKPYTKDKKLFALAELEEKYPYGDRALMDALYVKTLSVGETAIDRDVLIISPDAAYNLYISMSTGFPQTQLLISYAGEGIPNGGSIFVPRGMTMRDIVVAYGNAPEGCILVENDLLTGKPIKGVVNDSTRAIISVKPQKPSRSGCISCGECVSVCPVRLYPFEALGRNRESMKKSCIYCGACSYICPSGIPLTELIRGTPKKEATE